LLDFNAVQYARKGNAVADDEQLSKIAKIPKRELMRRRVNQHTLEKICRQVPVRAVKFAKCLQVIEEIEKERFDVVQRP
jgi:hypothetical protein